MIRKMVYEISNISSWYPQPDDNKVPLQCSYIPLQEMLQIQQEKNLNVTISFQSVLFKFFIWILAYDYIKAKHFIQDFHSWDNSMILEYPKDNLVIWGNYHRVLFKSVLYDVMSHTTFRIHKLKYLIAYYRKQIFSNIFTSHCFKVKYYVFLLIVIV